jgi:hypothetical protein
VECCGCGGICWGAEGEWEGSEEGEDEVGKGGPHCGSCEGEMPPSNGCGLWILGRVVRGFELGYVILVEA